MSTISQYPFLIAKPGPFPFLIRQLITPLSLGAASEYRQQHECIIVSREIHSMKTRALLIPPEPIERVAGGAAQSRDHVRRAHQGNEHWNSRY